MTQRDPAQRKTVQQYRLLLQGVLEGGGDIAPPSPSLSEKTMPPIAPPQTTTNYPFKSEFEDILLPFYMRLHWCGYTPDDRINIICSNFPHLMEVIASSTDPDANNFFTNAMASIPGLSSQSAVAETISLDKIDVLQQQGEAAHSLTHSLTHLLTHSQGEAANVAKSLISNLPFESLLATRKRTDADSNVYFKELLSVTH
jgi:hypothetical protein